MRLERYLKRIDYAAVPLPDMDTLFALQRAHALTVPFENFDVQFGNRLTIDPEAAYDKIVLRRRGGWCYEQNGLFGWALAEIGFDVTRVAASVMREQRGAASYANHLCLLVQFDREHKTYLADVGFGGSLLQPIELREADHDQAPFRLGLRRLDERYWRFWESTGNGEFSFDFVAEPGDEKAMSTRCEYLQTAPSSGFVQNLVVQRRNPHEHLTLRGRILSIARSKGTETRSIDSADALTETLKRDFGLDIPQAAALWPQILKRHEEVERARDG